MMRAHYPSIPAVPFVACLLTAILAGCDSRKSPAAQAPFVQNVEAVRFVRSIRESLSQARRPSSADVQRLKRIASQYPDEDFVEEVIVSILPALKDWDGLAAYYEAKAELDQTQRSMLARVYIKQSNYAGARDAIQVVADAQPNNTEANALLGRALYFFGEYERASQCYDRVWDSIVADQRVGDITFRAMIDFDQGDSTRAVQTLLAGLEKSPDSIAMHNALSRVLAAEGELERASVHRDRATFLQEELSRKETEQMLRAARVFALNRALKAGDLERCQGMIFEYLPSSDANFQEDLYRFLEAMYQRAGRSAETGAVLERARQAARKAE